MKIKDIVSEGDVVQFRRTKKHPPTKTQTNKNVESFLTGLTTKVKQYFNTIDELSFVDEEGVELTPGKNTVHFFIIPEEDVDKPTILKRIDFLTTILNKHGKIVAEPIVKREGELYTVDYPLKFSFDD